MKTMIKGLLLTFLLSSFLFGNSQVKPLSSQSKICLLTVGPGNDLYSIFGHTAIRVKDPEQNFDLAFNYGTFAFSDDFYFQFTMGKLNYRLSIEPYDRFVAGYQYENRWVREQVLNLDSTQKQQVFEFLVENSQPKNAYYLYDFFYDNCSTRPRDVFENILDNQLQYNYIVQENTKTFRNMIDLYLAEMPWSDAGIDLGLGTPCDLECTPRLKTFLPDYLMDEFDRATIQQNGTSVKLVKANNLIVDARPVVQEGFNWFHPLVFFIGFILLHNLILRSKKKWLIGTFDGLLYFIIGIAGWLVFFLWFVTDHNGTRPNWNILWAMSLYIPFGIGLIIWSKSAIFKYPMQLLNFLLLLCLLTWPFLPQNLNEFYLPIVVWLLYRNSDRLGWFEHFKALKQRKFNASASA